MSAYTNRDKDSTSADEEADERKRKEFARIANQCTDGNDDETEDKQAEATDTEKILHRAVKGCPEISHAKSIASMMRQDKTRSAQSR